MTLAVGTALQNGTYVIDAWVADDAVGPVYLAMDVSRGQWVQLRVLGSRSPETLPDACERQAFYGYLTQVNGLKHSALPDRLGGFEEEGVCYQTLASPPGTPLDRLIPDTQPLAPRPSLAVLHQLIEVLGILRPLGWAGLRLTPDQVWYVPATQTLTFTGFDLAPPAPAEPDAQPDLEGNSPISAAESALVRGLSHLLYFLLTGQRAEATKAPLAVELRRRHPTLPTSLDAALEAGNTTPTVSLTEWGALLPAANQLPPAAPLPVIPVSVTGSRPTAPASVVVGHHLPTPPVDLELPTRHPLPLETVSPALARRRPVTALALVFTGLIATASGLGFGLYARLQPASSASPERLNPNQSFPPLPDWKGGDSWQPWDDAPALRRRPDYSDTPPPGSQPAPDFTPNPQEPAAPPPAVARPRPSPEPVPEAVEPWDTPVEPWSQPDPGAPNSPAPLPSEAPAPAPEPLAPPPLEAPPLSAPVEGSAPQPLTLPPQAPAPAPASS